MILGSALQQLLHCCQQLDHGAEFVSCSFELMAAELGLPKEKRLEVQANAWAVLHLPPPESAEGAEVGPFQRGDAERGGRAHVHGRTVHLG